MSGDAALKLAADVLLWGGLALFLVGMIVQTIADASLRKRPRLAVAGGLILAVGEIMPHELEGDWISISVKLAAAAVFIGCLFLPRRRRVTGFAAAVASLAILAVMFRDAWISDGLAAALRNTATIIGVLVALAGGIWLLSLADKLYRPGPYTSNGVLRRRANPDAANAGSESP